MDPILISVAVFVGVVALVGGVAFVMRDFGSTEVEDRLQVMTGRKARDGADAITRDELLKEGISGISGMFGGVAERLKNMSLLFEQADSPVKPETFLGMTVGSAAVGIGLGWVGRAPAPLYPVFAMMFGVMPFMWLLWRRKKRFKRFARQMPDAMELIARALRSGHSLASGLHVVVEEMPAPISEEFGKAYEEQNLGVPLEAALKNMLKRMPNMDLKFFATAVAIQRTAGGDMAEILDKIGYIVRERFKIMGQVQALTGEGRISGVVLMALPIALFFAVYYLNREYVMLLFTEELGRKMIAAAAVLQVLGAICIKKIVAIKI